MWRSGASDVAYQPNTGAMPDACKILDEDGNVAGYRAVHVRLFGAPDRGAPPYDSKARGDPPWPAGGGRGGATNWKISRPPHVAEIEFYEVV